MSNRRSWLTYLYIHYYDYTDRFYCYSYDMEVIVLFQTFDIQPCQNILSCLNAQDTQLKHDFIVQIDIFYFYKEISLWFKITIQENFKYLFFCTLKCLLNKVNAFKIIQLWLILKTLVKYQNELHNKHLKSFFNPSNIYKKY